MKKLLALVLAFTLLLCQAALAADTDTGKYETAAERLYALNLFLGRGNNENGEPVFDLESPATRQEAVVMLLRLLQRDDNAEAAQCACPFADVSGWAEPYVGYAAEYGLVQGRSQTVFDAESNISAAEFLTMVLRALYYHSENEPNYGGAADFKWDESWLFSDGVGLTDGSYGADTAEFLRGDMALIASAALDTFLKGTTSTLLDHMSDEGLKVYENISLTEVSKVKTGDTSSVCPVLPLMTAVSHGRTDYFVRSDAAWQLLALACGKTSAVEDGKAVTPCEETITEGTGIPDIFDYGSFTVTTDWPGMGMDHYELRIALSLGEKTLSFLNRRGMFEGYLHFNDGARYIHSGFYVSGYWVWVNADDLLDYFGLAGSFGVEADESGELIWALN